jgi:guanidinopropionase
MDRPTFNERAAYDDSYDPRLAPRYAEIATFMRAPLRIDLQGVDVGIAGVPFDGGVTVRGGARHGPRALREQSTMMRGIHHVFRFDPFELVSVADVGDVRFNSLFDHDGAEDDIRVFFERLQAAGVTGLAAGGDHSITFAILQALRSPVPLGLVHLDAHCDTWGPLHGTAFHHGSPFRRAVEAGLVDPARTVQIGMRGAQNSSEGWDFCAQTGMRVLFAEEVDALGVAGVVAEARRIVGEGPAYLSLDIDVLDPAWAPGTGTPEMGGLSMREVQGIVRGMRGLRLAGADVVEVAPPFDPAGVTALAGATLMYELLCLLAEARTLRS